MRSLLLVLIALVSIKLNAQNTRSIEEKIVLQEDHFVLIEPSFVKFGNHLFVLNKNRQMFVHQYELKTGKLKKSLNLSDQIAQNPHFNRIQEKIKSKFDISSKYITRFKDKLLITCQLDYVTNSIDDNSRVSNCKIYCFLDSNLQVLSGDFLGWSEFEPLREDDIRSIPIGIVGDTLVFNNRVEKLDSTNIQVNDRIYLLRCYLVKDNKLTDVTQLFPRYPSEINTTPPYFSNCASFYPFECNSWNQLAYVSDGYAIYVREKDIFKKVLNEIPLIISYKFSIVINDTLFISKNDIDFDNNLKVKSDELYVYHHNKRIDKISYKRFNEIYGVNLENVHETYCDQPNSFYFLKQENDNYTYSTILIK